VFVNHPSFCHQQKAVWGEKIYKYASLSPHYGQLSSQQDTFEDQDLQRVL
jgi:hypothetical protein